MSKLLAGEIDEGQIVEAGGDGGVVLDEGVAAGVLRKELMNPRVMTQQTAVGSERKAAEITPANTKDTEINILTLCEEPVCMNVQRFDPKHKNVSKCFDKLD